MRKFFILIFYFLAVYCSFGQIYPLPAQLLNFYHVKDAVVIDSLIAHGYVHSRTYVNAEKNNYRRYVFTKDCLLNRDGRATNDSPDEGLIVEFSCYGGIVENIAIEVLTGDRYNYYMNLCVNLGYKHNVDGGSPSRYLLSELQSVNRLNFHKKVKRVHDEYRPGKFKLIPIPGNLYFDTYSLPGVNGLKSYNIGVSKVISSNPYAFIGSCTTDGDKILWDISDEGPVKLELSNKLNEKIMKKALGELPDGANVVANFADNDRHCIYYLIDKISSSSWSDRATMERILYKKDIYDRTDMPRIISNANRMKVIKTPDNIHLIIISSDIQQKFCQFEVYNTISEEIENSIDTESAKDISILNDGSYLVTNSSQIMYFDVNGKVISKASGLK